VGGPCLAAIALSFVSNLSANPSIEGKITCLSGPTGVGKTSIDRSIAAFVKLLIYGRKMLRKPRFPKPSGAAPNAETPTEDNTEKCRKNTENRSK
ncbi:hypothetical protein PIB30_053097, partial [Stylosanthes scabra]|nr:hypothetical protein [Stylosanthes scabra]